MSAPTRRPCVVCGRQVRWVWEPVARWIHTRALPSTVAPHPAQGDDLR